MDLNERQNIAVAAFEAHTGEPWATCGRRDHWMTMVDDLLRGREEDNDQFRAVKAAYAKLTAPVAAIAVEAAPEVPAGPPPDDPNADLKATGKKK